MNLHGIIHKLKAQHKTPIEYFLPIGEEDLSLNPCLGKKIQFEFTGDILCSHCHKKTKKSFQQGYCFVCATTLARCDICIVRPEKCHFHLGTCREPDWAQTHCFIPHYIYLANTSGLKVGITRATQIPTRWIDQGASQALKIARVNSRHQAGLIEIELAKQFADKTDWRKMLKAKPEALELNVALEQLRQSDVLQHEDLKSIEWLDESIQNFEYPVLQYPEKVKSISVEKTPHFSGCLVGIKGQYLIFEEGVLNMRNLAGYDLKLAFES